MSTWRPLTVAAWASPSRATSSALWAASRAASSCTWSRAASQASRWARAGGVELDDAVGVADDGRGGHRWRPLADDDVAHDLVGPLDEPGDGLVVADDDVGGEGHAGVEHGDVDPLEVGGVHLRLGLPPPVALGAGDVLGRRLDLDGVGVVADDAPVERGQDRAAGVHHVGLVEGDAVLG